MTRLDEHEPEVETPAVRDRWAREAAAHAARIAERMPSEEQEDNR